MVVLVKIYSIRLNPTKFVAKVFLKTVTVGVFCDEPLFFSVKLPHPEKC